jgi:CRISPR/Cas system-associated exonuclease Cas4 (RecB family)
LTHFILFFELHKRRMLRVEEIRVLSKVGRLKTRCDHKGVSFQDEMIELKGDRKIDGKERSSFT